MLLLVVSQFPWLKVTADQKLFKGFNVAKLFVQVSIDWSTLVKLYTVKLFPFPDTSAPRLLAFSKSKWNPLVPKVKPDTSIGFQILGLSLSNSPNDVGSKDWPSIKTDSAKYPPNQLLPLL